MFVRELRVQSALFHRCRKESESRPRKGSICCSKLCEHVVAVAIVLDHGLQATDLTLDPLETLDDVVVVFRLEVHGGSIPLGGINSWLSLCARN